MSTGAPLHILLTKASHLLDHDSDALAILYICSACRADLASESVIHHICEAGFSGRCFAFAHVMALL